MSILDVVFEPNPVLHQVCDPVKTFDNALESLVSDMFDTMKANDGIGLAAPQVGILDRLFICQVKRKKLVCINPDILAKRGEVVMEEGCLSLPNILAEVHRAEEIDVAFQDLNGDKQQLTLTGLMAIVFQHEYDHLDGLLITKTGKITQAG